MLLSTAQSSSALRVLALVCFGLACSSPAGCSMPAGPEEHREGAGPGGRDQPLALSPAEEQEVGRKAYQQVMSELGDRVLPANSPEAARVRRVVERLAHAAEIEPLQREIKLRVQGYQFEWNVKVVRDSQANAFCLPGGRIFVFTGILPVIGERDDALATVLAHEMAHALAHHASERVAREQQAGGNFLRGLSYDRMQESEADHIGVFIMTFAGYDPDEAVAFWERMRQAHAGGARPEWLSDHPSDEHRIRALREWVPKARAAKKAFDEGRIVPAR
ncbi:MAG: putative Peptidase Ste24p [Gemmataceae bacterium]|nr:putative Peptidase Ste24p [Gemmataceae bacterium]